MPGYNIVFTTESLAEAHAAAAKRGTTLARLMHDLLRGGPAQVLANASGGALDVATVRYAMDLADTIMDTYRGMDLADWLSAADTLLTWLKANPYHPNGAGRVAAWWAARPACVVEAMHDAVAR
jgi:hypothetical protein